MKTYNLSAQPRTAIGKKATKELRNAGLIPVVLNGGEVVELPYNGNLNEGEQVIELANNKGVKVTNLTVKVEDVRKLIYTPDIYAIDLDVNGVKKMAVLKDIQFHPVKEEIDITIGKPLKNGLASLKIVALSDLHLGSGSYKNWLQQRVDEINDCKPDLILIGGDLIDNSLVPVRNTVLEDIVNRLQAPMGIYAVPGNHEYFSNVDECRKWMDENTPIRMLRDEVVTLPCGLQIVGRDDRQNRRRLPLERVVEQVNDTLPTVLLDHQPSDLGVAARNNIDLQFSGHTHHGQIWPLTLLTDRLFELSYGFRKIGNTCYYVSSGLGLWGPPFRIGTQSEFVVFNISFKE